MIFFHRFEEIKDFPMAFRYKDVDLRAPPFNFLGFPQIQTLDAMKDDLWDYHLDHKRWWQQAHNVSPPPSVKPHYGKAFAKIRLKISKIVFRQTVTTYAPSGTNLYGRPDSGVPFILNPALPIPAGEVFYQDNQGPGNSHLLFASVPFPTQASVPPTSTTFPVYYASCWAVSTGSPSDTATTHLGVFMAHKTVFNMPVSPGFTATVLRDETIDNFKVARLNYLTPVDSKVLRKGIGSPPAADPQPTTEALWRGAWDVDTQYELSDIVSRGIRTYFSIRAGKGFDPAVAPTHWERCNRPKTQIVAGSVLSLIGKGTQIEHVYLFPGRTDIMTICQRIYPSLSPPFTKHDWRGNPNSTLGFPFGDRLGLAVYPPEAVGFNGPFPPNTPFDFTTGTPPDRSNGLTNVPNGPFYNETVLGDDTQSYVFYENQQDYFIEEFIRVGLTFV